jgi:glutamyl-tRNA synthetase
MPSESGLPPVQRPAAYRRSEDSPVQLSFRKKNNGTFILRIEDTDQGRFVEGAENYIMDSLEWCGIHVDEGVREGGKYGPYRQSDRKDIYRQYADVLIDRGDAYYAFDTPENSNS